MSDKPVILLVHVDPRVRVLAALELSRDFALESVAPADARAVCERLQPALAILDAPGHGAMPLDLISDFRTLEKPVIVLGDDREPDAHAHAIALGADDFVARPFDDGELLRRVRFLLGMEPPYAESHLVKTNGIEVDLIREIVRAHGEVVRMSEPEWALLKYLAENPGMVCLYREIRAMVWQNKRDMNYLRVCADSLRNKLGDHPEQPVLLLDFHGVGYSLASV
jgi:DNA-binding response OmpR family regulator